MRLLLVMAGVAGALTTAWAVWYWPELLTLWVLFLFQINS